MGILHMIGFFAITFNVFYALVHMPLGSWWTKLLIFVAVEKGLMSMRYFVQSWTWPEDVTQMEDDIATVKQAIKAKEVSRTSSPQRAQQPDLLPRAATVR